jgi:hypothetical protein
LNSAARLSRGGACDGVAGGTGAENLVGHARDVGGGGEVAPAERSMKWGRAMSATTALPGITFTSSTLVSAAARVTTAVKA